MLQNYKMPGGIWPFGVTPIADKYGWKLVEKNPGHTTLFGETYDVTDESTEGHEIDFPNGVATLTQRGGDKRCQVISVKFHDEGSLQSDFAIVENEDMGERYFKISDPWDFDEDGYFHKYFDGVYAEPIADGGYDYYLKYREYFDLDHDEVRDLNPNGILEKSKTKLQDKSNPSSLVDVWKSCDDLTSETVSVGQWSDKEQTSHKFKDGTYVLQVKKEDVGTSGSY